MFFDEISLSKKSWHFKLMSATFGGNPPDLWSFCPYFWLTILCMIISPITFFVYLIGVWPTQGIKFLYRITLEKRFNEWVDNLPDYAVAQLEDSDLDIPKLVDDGYYRRKNKALERLLAKRGINFTGDYDKEYLAILHKSREEWQSIRDKQWDEKRAKEDAQEQKEYLNRMKWEKRKDFFRPLTEAIGIFFSSIANKIKKLFTITKLVVWTKRIVSLAISLFLAWLLFIISKAIYGYVSIHPVDWRLLSQVSNIVLIILSVVTIAAVLIFLISRLIIKLNNTKIVYDDNNKFVEFLQSFARGIVLSFIWVYKFFAWLFPILLKPFQIFILYFKAVKSDNCPAINWEE